MPDSDKPPFQIETMKEIAKLKPNGFKVASTFSGCGGSCLGYRMAGFQVLWSNEFDEIARKSYRVNQSPDTILDERDLRKIVAEDILSAINMKQGELDLFDGSPPCQTFSTAGKRDMQDDRTDLFATYLDLVEGIQPKVFVAENVTGMIKGVAKGYFKRTMQRMKSIGYQTECRVLDAQWLGVPQARQRVIFVGVRSDLKLKPAYPKPLPYRYSVLDALPGLHEPNKDRPKLGPQVAEEWDNVSPGANSDKYFQLTKLHPDRPAATITGPSGTGLCHDTEKRRLSIAEIKTLCGFPADFKLVGSYAQQWGRLGNAVPPVMMKHIASTIRDEILLKL